MIVDQSVKTALREKLKDIFGFSQFRGDQEAIICSVLEGHNTFVIMPTGAGKSPYKWDSPRPLPTGI
ncbi:MAG: hypothetical protein H7Y12_09620 [Sphingobacteriaceae bacterium]|nr:hypothetical protein [Cytophagaceae bacterium]